MANGYKYASTQINLPADLAKEVIAAGAAIPDEDLGNDGRELEAHVTIKYGVDEDEEALREAVKDFPQFEVVLGEVAFFPPRNEDGTPVIIEVELSDELKKFHEVIMDAAGIVKDEFPYAPHVTLAYVKDEETAKKYAGESSLTGQKFIATSLVLSKMDGTKVSIPLGSEKFISPLLQGRVAPVGIRYGSFTSHLLTAKLPHADMDRFKRILQPLLPRLQNKGDEEIKDILNETTSSTGVTYQLGSEESGLAEQARNYIANNSGYLPESGLILIMLEYGIGNLFEDISEQTWDRFLNSLMSVISHENTHKSQLNALLRQHGDDTEKLNRGLTQMTPNPYENRGKYNTSPHEIAAFARQAVEELRASGYSDADITKKLHGPIEDFAGDSDALYWYWDNYGQFPKTLSQKDKEDAVFPRFLKEMYKVLKSAPKRARLLTAKKLYNGGNGEHGKTVTYFTPNREMAESYVSMYNDRFGDGGKLNEMEVNITNPAPYHVIEEAAQRLGIDNEMYTPASIFDANLHGENEVAQLVAMLKKSGYDGAVLDDIAYGKQIQDKAFIKFSYNKLSPNQPGKEYVEDTNGWADQYDRREGDEAVIPLEEVAPQMFEEKVAGISFYDEESGEMVKQEDFTPKQQKALIKEFEVQPLYHVTFADLWPKLKKEGLRVGQRGGINDGWEPEPGYKSDKVFVCNLVAAKKWAYVAEDQVRDRKTMILEIRPGALKGNLHFDIEGTRQRKAVSFYTTKPIPPSDLKVYQAKTASLKFVKDERSKDEALITISTAALDQSWSKDEGYYIPPGAGENTIGNRLERFKQWLANNPDASIKAPIVSWNDVKGCVSFTDGRHRFSVLRDMGYPTVQISVPRTQVDIFKRMKTAATYQRIPAKVTTPNGYYAEYTPHPVETDSNTWKIYAPMGKLEIPRDVGELTVDFYEDAVTPYPSIRSIHLKPEYIGKGIGRAIVRELAKFYGGMTSDPQANTSDMAVSMWKSLGAEKIPTDRNHTKGFFYQITGATESPLNAAQNSMKKFLREFWPDLPAPTVKIVNHAAPDFLGKNIFTWKSPEAGITENDHINSIIQIQKSICGHERTLDRVMAHELCHHAENMTHIAPIKTKQEVNLMERLFGNHGKWWQAEAAKVNARYGSDFVTKDSDTSDVVEGEKEFYVLLHLIDGKRLGWTWAVRPSKKQKLFIERQIALGDKLVKSKDSSLAPSNGLMGRPGWLIPSDEGIAKKLSYLWNEAPAVKV